MKKKIGILTNSDKYQSISIFKEAISSLGHTPIVHILHNDLTPNELTQYDILFNRVTGISYNDSELEVLNVIEKVHPQTKIINSTKTMFSLRDKWAQFNLFEKEEIQCIQTHTLPTTFTELRSLFEGHNSNIIVKPFRGNKGIGIIQIQNETDLKSFYDSSKARNDFRYIIQPLINIKREFRVIFINSTPQIFFEKINNDNNTEVIKNLDSCIFTEISLPREVSPLLKKMTKLLSEINSSFIGADIALDHYTRPILIEANVVPGVNSFTKEHIHRLLSALI